MFGSVQSDRVRCGSAVLGLVRLGPKGRYGQVGLGALSLGHGVVCRGGAFSGDVSSGKLRFAPGMDKRSQSIGGCGLFILATLLVFSPVHPDCRSRFLFLTCSWRLMAKFPE